LEANNLEEYLTVSCNFQFLVKVMIGDRTVAGLVEQMDDDQAMIAGAWYPIDEIAWAVQ
jgi:hypothetical protein